MHLALKFNLHTLPMTKLLESPNNGGHFYSVTSFGIRLIVLVMSYAQFLTPIGLLMIIVALN